MQFEAFPVPEIMGCRGQYGQATALAVRRRGCSVVTEAENLLPMHVVRIVQNLRADAASEVIRVVPPVAC